MSKTELDVDEGGTAQYDVRLGTRPDVDVTVTVRVKGGSEDKVSVSPATLRISAQNWNTSQTVTVTGNEYADAADESDVAVYHTSSPHIGKEGVVRVNVADNDAEAVLVSTTSVDVNEGDAATFTVPLATKPSWTVYVVPTSGDSCAASVSTSRRDGKLQFDTVNWRKPQSVTVHGVQDDDANDETVSVSLAVFGVSRADYDGVLAPEVSISVDDDDESVLTGPWSGRWILRQGCSPARDTSE